MAFALTVVSAVAAGCGSDGEPSATATATDTATEAPAEAAEETGSDSASASAPESAATDEAEADEATGNDTADAADDGTTDGQGGTRTVVTDFGEFEVPVDLARTVILDPIIALPTALDLGIPVVGTLGTNGGPSTVALVTEEEWADLEILGDTTSSSLEAVAAADPDLILVSPSSVEEFELYAQIAPSVPTVPTNSWKDDARQVGDALGRADQLEDILAAYQRQADALADRIDDELDDPVVALVRVRPDAIRVHTNAHFGGNVILDAGLRIPDEFMREQTDDPVANLRLRVQEISLEQLELLAEADHLIVLVQGTPAQSTEAVAASFESVSDSPLWQALPAVAAGNVHLAEPYWLAGSLRAATAGLNDIEGWLLDG